MKYLYTTLLLFLFCFTIAQNNFSSPAISQTVIVTPPSNPVRTIGEWEELQGLVVAWKSYTTMIREIVRDAKQQCKVFLLYEPPDNVAGITSSLASVGVDTVNVQFVSIPLNSVWSRDYGPWSAYINDVDTLITIDWRYNRSNRPDDDAVPAGLSSVLNTPLYQTTTPPWDLVHTGGNFMCDGFGTGFSSNLILADNSASGGFGVNHTVAEIDTIMSRFMGINRYIKMNTLPYDQIHHIDMHMKLLDEETLLMGEYPTGIADGPVIEANLQYVLTNYMSVYGTPYKIIRIPMPPDNGLYPSNGGDYFTYTNSSFINNTILVPVYNIPQDTTALRIYREALPGYKVVGINSTASIGALGALHCITKEIATSDPLLISHQVLQNTSDTINDYNVIARIQHKSGVSSAYIYYRTDTTQPYVQALMNVMAGQPNWWEGKIPTHSAGAKIYYYIQANAMSGKQQVRPMPAPAGYWKFEVLGTTGSKEEIARLEMKPVFPNPSKGITCIPFNLSGTEKISALVVDINGRKVLNIYNGVLKQGEQKLFVNAALLNTGVYIVEITAGHETCRQRLVVR